jgi:hexosaminidase
VQQAVHTGLQYARDGRIQGVIAYGLPVDGKPRVASDNRAMYGNGRLSITVAPFVATSAGSFAYAEQTVTVDPNAPRYELSFWHWDEYARTSSGVGYHFKQVLIDDAVVWESDVMDSPQRTWLNGYPHQGAIDVTARLRGKTSARLTFRVYDKRGVGDFMLDVGFDNIETIGFTVRNPGFETRTDWFCSGNHGGMTATVDVAYPDRPQRIFDAVSAEYADASASVPQTVPALREWTAGTGFYLFTAASRIVVDPQYAAALDGDAATFGADLGALAGRSVTIVHGAAGAADVYLTLGGADVGEGYTMTVGSSVTIQAGTAAGVFYGTRTMLQLLHQSSTIPAGVAHDWPTKPERGLMVDQGRKYLTVLWLQAHIRELAYLKLNTFHFHLSDTFGFRLESARHPEVVSSQHYRKQEIADLVALGQRYHVTIVPEIDMPGHMDAILASHPELKLTNSFIDLSRDGAYTLVKDLIEEYLPLFPGSSWHLGADEYVSDYSQYPQLLTYARNHYGPGATAKDNYYGFINWADSLVRAAGKTLRMWNDGINAGDGTITPAADILVEYWTAAGLTPQQLVDAGHPLANQSRDPTYYVLGGAKPNVQWAYETWTPDLFQDGATIAEPARNRGTNLHVWCDSPNVETEDQVAAGITSPLRVIAQQTWGSPKPAARYPGFGSIADAVGRSPGWPTQTPPDDKAAGKPVAVSSTETPNFPGLAATDGSYTTRWSSAYTDPSWIRVDLGARTSINRVVLRWEAAYGRGYTIQVSDDAVTWTTIYTTTTGDGGTDDLTGLAGTGRYVRMYGTARSTQYGYSLWELEVYGS